MYGLGAAFLPAIAAGASIDMQAHANLLRYMERERQFDPNVAFLTPTLCEMLLVGRRASRPYKLVVTAGDRIKAERFLAFETRFGCLVNLYGSTEMGAIAAQTSQDPLEVRMTTVGKPMPGVQIRLNITSTERDSEINPVGTLWCQHAYGFEGYVMENGAKDDQDIPTQSEWFETRDMGRIRQDGYLEVFGRYDQSVNRSGLLVLFADIEQAIETIEGIKRVIVVVKGESKRGQRLIAFCVPCAGTVVCNTHIRTACFRLLPRHAIPDEVIIVQTLPLLANGKVDRQALVAMASEEQRQPR